MTNAQLAYVVTTTKLEPRRLLWTAFVPRRRLAIRSRCALHWPTPPRERRGGTCPPARPGGSFSRTQSVEKRFASRRFVFLSATSDQPLLVATQPLVVIVQSRSLSFRDISSRIRRSSLVRLSSPCSEILSSTRLSCSSGRFGAIFGLGVGGELACRRATAALLFATMSSTSCTFSRERGSRGIGRGVSSGTSGIGDTRCFRRSRLVAEDVRRYSQPAASPPRCARYARPVRRSVPATSVPAIPATRLIAASI